MLAALAAAPAAAAQEPSWRLEQPDPPEGFEFRTPLGAPGDLQFYDNRRNRGLLGIEGNAAIPRGLYLYDGGRWRQLSTVCGGAADGMRIAWAGPTEWWTVSEPSAPRRGGTVTLCHFKDGQVVASFGTRDNDADPYRPMNAATCRAPDDCWFAGIGAEDGSGSRRGAFHLHWNGSTLETVYNPQGRGVSDLEAHQGTIFESVFVGKQAESGEPADLARAESPRPRLLHRIVGGAFTNDEFVPARGEDEPADGAELLGLDSSGDGLWAVGGGAASGASAPPGGVVPRGPLAARLVGSAFQERSLTAPMDTFDGADRFSDVAAIPGTPDAWVTVQPFAERRSTSAKARVARIDGLTGAVEETVLPSSGAGRGSAARIAFNDPGDGWMVTRAGWLFHFTDGSPRTVDDDPALRDLISFRPNENAEQFIPDAPPADDNSTFAAPPVEIAPSVSQEPAAVQTKRLSALLARFKVTVRRSPLAVVVTFTLRRRARVALIGLRRGRTVGRTRTRTLRPGRRKLVLRVTRRRYPTRLKFSTRELDVSTGPASPDDAGGGAGDTVTTGGAP